jgi:hypothetical protein
MTRERGEMDRRAFLHSMGAAGAWGIASSVTPASAASEGHILHEVAEPGRFDAVAPRQSIRFAVCGMSHDHICGMVGAIVR